MNAIPSQRWPDPADAPQMSPDELTAHIRSDEAQMLPLIELDANEQDEGERLDQLNELRWLLGRASKDPHAMGQLQIYMRDFATLGDELAEAQAKYQFDNGEL